MKTAYVSSGTSGSSTERRRGKRATAASTRSRTAGRRARSRRRRPRAPRATRARALEARRERLEHPLARLDVGADRAGGVEARRQRPAAVERDEPVRRLVPDDAAARGRDPDRAGRVGAERRLLRGRRRGRRRAAARSARDAAGEARVRDVAEMRVLGGRAVRKLVQVGLADYGVACLLEQSDRRRRLGAGRGRRRSRSRTSSPARPCRTGPSPPAGSRAGDSVAGRSLRSPRSALRGALGTMRIPSCDGKFSRGPGTGARRRRCRRRGAGRRRRGPSPASGSSARAPG